MRGAGPLKEGGGEGQFQDQREETGLQQEKTEGRRGVGLIRAGQNHTRRGKVFRGQGPFGEVRRIQWLG